MADLIELSDDVTTSDCSLVIADYTTDFQLCRSGIWLGTTCLQSQRVVLSYEHEPEPLYVGWSINGSTVLDPGYGTFTPPWGAPCPGDPDVTYQTGVDWLYHRIAFSVVPGTATQSVNVQVLYRGSDGAGQPASAGPSRTVQLAGVVTNWPASKLEEERECWRRLTDLLRQYIEIPKWWPPDPWERLPDLVRDPEDMLVLSAVTAVAELDAKADADLIAQYRLRAGAIVGRLSFGDPVAAKGGPSPP